MGRSGVGVGVAIEVAVEVAVGVAVEVEVEVEVAVAGAANDPRTVGLTQPKLTKLAGSTSRYRR
jgi:hypothetical protein